MNFGIGIGAITFSAETEIVFSINFDFCQMADWKINNKWKYYHCTPYEQTVILDTDMLFMTDLSHWWEYFSHWDMMATTNVQTYRGETIIDNHYRKTFGPNYRQ